MGWVVGGVGGGWGGWWVGGGGWVVGGGGVWHTSSDALRAFMFWFMSSMFRRISSLRAPTFEETVALRSFISPLCCC